MDSALHQLLVRVHDFFENHVNMIDEAHAMHIRNMCSLRDTYNINIHVPDIDIRFAIDFYCTI